MEILFLSVGLQWFISKKMEAWEAINSMSFTLSYHHTNLPIHENIIHSTSLLHLLHVLLCSQAGDQAGQVYRQPSLSGLPVCLARLCTGVLTVLGLCTGVQVIMWRTNTLAIYTAIYRTSLRWLDTDGARVFSYLPRLLLEMVGWWRYQ